MNDLKKFCVIGFFATTVLGILSHFVYDWTGGGFLIGLFFPVNESTWEHMKLLFWPMLLFAVVQSFFFKDRGDFWCVKLRGILLGLLLIPVIFYTYNGVIGKSPDWLNIAIFFVAAAAVYFYETRLYQKETVRCSSPKRAVAALGGLAVLFVVFTFITPEIGIFRDPLTGTYGI